MNYSLGKTILNVDNVSVRYGDNIVLSGVSGQIKDIIVPGEVKGQVVGILGPSGCGKSTLFRVIAGLQTPSEGKVSVDNLDRPVRAGEVGVVAQSYPLFEHRTILGNLMLAAKQREKDSKVAHDKVMEMLTEFGLEDKAKLYPAQLSGGQKQRCAILQQILCADEILLMDEPFSGLDLIMLEKVCELINKVANRSEESTVIVVTHDVTAACSVSDHLWMMGKTPGKLGSSIVKEYNLIDSDLCWHPEIITTQVFTELVREVKEEFRRL